MENKKLEVSPNLTKKELLQRQWEQAVRELKISRAKSGVFRNKVLESYSILDNLRFDYLSDTAFRDKITRAKQALESTINDFLLSDTYWEQRIKEMQSRSPEEYDKYLKSPVTQEAQSSAK